MVVRAEDMRLRAERLRRLAAQERDLWAAVTYKRLAEGFERQARKLEEEAPPAQSA